MINIQEVYYANSYLTISIIYNLIFVAFLNINALCLYIIEITPYNVTPQQPIISTVVSKWWYLLFRNLIACAIIVHCSRKDYILSKYISHI